MTREQMIDEAVRDYMEYRLSIWEPYHDTPREWALEALECSWMDRACQHVIEFAYWKIKTAEEFYNS